MFIQVQYPLSLTYIKYKHFLIFGWGESAVFLYFCIRNTFLGAPFLNMMLWAGLIFSFDERNMKVKHCFLMEKSEWDLVTNIPCIIILIFNTFFLIWIMMVRNIQIISSCKYQNTSPDCCFKIKTADCYGS